MNLPPRDAIWWQTFEARVDSTGVPAQDPIAMMLDRPAKEDRPVCRQDFADMMRVMSGDPEDKSPVLMSVSTPAGLMSYCFDVVDLEAVSWLELPKLIATEGPANFREVTALAKSKYEQRCGYLTLTIHRLPRKLIKDLMSFR